MEDKHTIQQKGTRRETSWKLGDKLADKLGDKSDKASVQWTRHPTKGSKDGDKLEDKLGGNLGDKLETREARPREGGHTIQRRETKRKTSWETIRRQAGGQDGRQAGR